MSGSLSISCQLPCDPLELQSALINCVLGSSPCRALSRTPFGLSCESDFSVRLEAIGCSRPHFPPWLSAIFGRVPLRVSSQGWIEETKTSPAMRRGRDPARKGWEGNAHCRRRLLWAKSNRTHRSADSALHAERRGRGNVRMYHSDMLLTAQTAQGGRVGIAVGQ